MARKIQFNIIQSLFRLFSFLADKTGGWIVFVKPKILLGSIILGFTACSSNTAKQSASEQSDTLKIEILQTADTVKKEIETPKADTVKEEKNNNFPLSPPPIIEILCYDPAPEIIMCYISILPEEPEIKEFDENYIYPIAEKIPEFPGGDVALRRFINENLNIPVVMCYEGGMPQGRVILQFVVEADGSITDIEVIRGIDPLLDREAVRLIQSMPKWTPGEQGGETVRVRYTLPVNFRL